MIKKGTPHTNVHTSHIKPTPHYQDNAVAALTYPSPFIHSFTMARAVGLVKQPSILCLPPATGDLPEHGGLIVSSPATPFRKPIEHAGHSYQQQLIRTYALNSPEVSSCDEQSQKSSDAESTHARRTNDAAKSLASKMAVGSDDLYELLELGEKRWHATADDIKKSFRRISLIYHPDKISHHGDEARANSEVHFKAVRKAYDILSDKKKRAAYDSIDDVDDSLPSEKDATSSAVRFYEKFGPCFALNARWCVSDRVPELGDDKADMKDVDRFYDFWYSFKSWRDFSFDLEYDTDQAECREEKRWMERQNSKSVKAKKLEENARIRRLVDLSFKHDPRLVRARQAVKDKKNAEKEKRKQKVEDAAKLVKDKEEKDRIETEHKAAEDKVKRVEAKKQKDAAKQILRKARQRLRAVGRQLQIMETERGLVAVETMCASGNAETINAVADALSAIPPIPQSRTDRAYQILDIALRTPLQPVSASTLSCDAAGPMKSEDAGNNSSPEVQNRGDCERPQVPNGTSNHSTANGHASDARKKEKTPWTQDELSLLSKGVTRFPGGTRDRWNRLAEYLGTRTVEEVLRKVNESRPSKIKAAARKQPVRKEPESSDSTRIVEKKNGKTAAPQKTVAKPSGTPAAASPPGQPPNKLEFTPKQQSVFENALKKIPKTDERRWNKVSAAVGRTPQHCQERFEELITFYAAKKAAKQ